MPVEPVSRMGEAALGGLTRRHGRGCRDWGVLRGSVRGPIPACLLCSHRLLGGCGPAKTYLSARPSRNTATPGPSPITNLNQSNGGSSRTTRIPTTTISPPMILPVHPRTCPSRSSMIRPLIRFAPSRRRPELEASGAQPLASPGLALRDRRAAKHSTASDSHHRADIGAAQWPASANWPAAKWGRADQQTGD